MKDLRKAFTEDCRRFGLVLFGAGALTAPSATVRILFFTAGFILVATAYVMLAATKDDES